MHTSNFTTLIEQSLKSAIADVRARAESVFAAYLEHEYRDKRIKPVIKQTETKLIIGWEFVDNKSNPYPKSMKFENSNSALGLLISMDQQQAKEFSLVESKLSYLRERASIFHSIRNHVIKKLTLL